MKKLSVFCLGVVFILAASFSIQASQMGSPMGSPMKNSAEKGDGPAAEAATAKAHATLKGTAEGSKITGTIEFEQINEGVSVKAHVVNVEPAGLHGFHIHEYGGCSDSGKAAGGHYNPEGVLHGLFSKDGPKNSHAGDMGNIEISADGLGHYEGFLPGISITGGQYNIGGRAVILHAKPDDFGQPTGNAGGRIGCGTIIIVSEK